MGVQYCETGFPFKSKCLTLKERKQCNKNHKQKIQKLHLPKLFLGRIKFQKLRILFTKVTHSKKFMQKEA